MPAGAISPQFLTLAYGVVVIIAVVASIVFIYHWRRFGTHIKAVKNITIIYTVVTAVLLVSAWLLLQAI